MPRTAATGPTSAEDAARRAHQRSLARARVAQHRTLAARSLPLVRALAAGEIETLADAQRRAREVLAVRRERADA